MIWNPKKTPLLSLVLSGVIAIMQRASLLFFKRIEDPTLIYDYTTYKYANSNERISYRGLEFEYKNKLFDAIDIRLNYTYNETTSGNLIYLPKQVFWNGFGL